MQISDLAEWVRTSTSRRWHRCSTAAADPRLLRRDRAGLPRPRPAVGHAVGRRGAARQDGPPPRLRAHRRHLRLRRAHHRPAPPRHPADERPAAAAARQGQHGPRRRAQAGDDRDRRPRRRPRPRRGRGGWHGLLRGHRRGSALQRHRHRPPPRRPGALEAHGSRRPPGALEIRGATTTTCGTSTSTSRSGCWLRSPVSPDRARARWCTGRSRAGDGRGIDRPGARSAVRAGATRRPTPACSTRSARPSPRPTA